MNKVAMYEEGIYKEAGLPTGLRQTLIGAALGGGIGGVAGGIDQGRKGYYKGRYKGEQNLYDKRNDYAREKYGPFPWENWDDEDWNKLSPEEFEALRGKLDDFNSVFYAKRTEQEKRDVKKSAIKGAVLGALKGVGIGGAIGAAGGAAFSGASHGAFTGLKGKAYKPPV